MKIIVETSNFVFKKRHHQLFNLVINQQIVECLTKLPTNKMMMMPFFFFIFFNYATFTHNHRIQQFKKASTFNSTSFDYNYILDINNQSAGQL
jgi:hypothetical protein